LEEFYEPLEQRPEASDKLSIGEFFREVVETVLLTLVLFFLIRTGIENFRVYGSSMEPNFHSGEYIIVNRLVYYLHPPRRGDVVIFRYPRDPRRSFIKRVIGLPGERVEIRQGKVYINGQLLQEPYPLNPGTYSWGPRVVGEDEVFVLGDNRNFSSDSHSWGMLPMRYIIGKAWICYWPPSCWKVIPSYEYPSLGKTTFNSPLSQSDAAGAVLPSALRWSEVSYGYQIEPSGAGPLF